MEKPRPVAALGQLVCESQGWGPRSPVLCPLIQLWGQRCSLSLLAWVPQPRIEPGPQAENLPRTGGAGG